MTGDTAAFDEVAYMGSEPAVEDPAAHTLAELANQRVLIYGMNYAPEFAGVGRYTGEIGADLARHGAAVRVITTPAHYPGWTVREGYRRAWYQRERLEGAHVFRCPLVLGRNVRGIWRLIAPLSFALTSAPVALWQIVRHRPNVVLCVEPTLLCAPLALLAAKLIGARTVLHVQDLEVDAAFAVGHLNSRKWLRGLAAWFERMALTGFGRVITISVAMRDRLAEKGVAAERLSVVRNWVDIEKIHPLEGPNPYRTELGIPEETFIVQYSGNIGPKQALHVLLDAAELLKERQDILFLVAGEGPEKAKLEKRYGHLANVRFIGFQPEERLCEFLNLADLHALPQETGAADLVLPSKLGGMLASGKPVIVTADEGTELAQEVEGCGVVTKPGDAVALAEEIGRLQTPPDHGRLGSSAANRRAESRWGRVELLATWAVELGK